MNSGSKVFFTSDTHFGHSNIIKYCHRPFLTENDKESLARDGMWRDGAWNSDGSSNHRISRESVQMMNETILNNINKIVGEDDTLWHLGDFCFGEKQDIANRAKFYRDRIKCRNVNLIWGNHDNRRAIRHLFSETYDLVNIIVHNQTIVLCHYAMAVFDKCHRGAIHLYGHSHSGAEEWMDQHMPNRRSIDVGVDNVARLFGEYRPLSFHEVMNLLGRKKGHFMDHHTKE